MASKRTRDLHIRLTEEEQKMGEEYAKYLKETAGVMCSWTRAYCALALKGYAAHRSEMKKKSRYA